MRRSEVNAIIQRSDAFIRSYGFALPPFASWSPAEFERRQLDLRDIFRAGLGWDVTDYGLGDFRATGLVLITLRNGDSRDVERGRGGVDAPGPGMLYAEKIMIVLNHQYCPMHRHIVKTEDIINRGGGRLVVELFASRSDGSIDNQARVQVRSDGVWHDLPPGGCLSLSPGESVTLPPGVWHAFQGEGDDVLVGEVSTVNDDRTDNVFRDRVGRFPDIIEDEPPLRLLVSDYARFGC